MKKNIKLFCLALALLSILGVCYAHPTPTILGEKNQTNKPTPQLFEYPAESPPKMGKSSPRLEGIGLDQANGKRRGSSLTPLEAHLILGGGRVFDFGTRTWSTRPPMSGVFRERFLVSWIHRRDRVGLNTPSEFLFSKFE